jgi:hypothetical protein
MKKALVALALGVGLAAMAFGGSTTISITPPQVTKLTISGVSVTGSALDPLNLQITNAFNQVQTDINNGELQNIHDLTQLSKGFANANTAAFDNASLLGYQTYDLFALMLGFDLGLAVPSTDPTAATSAVTDIAKNGDVYAGLATGGFAGQVGLHLGFLNPNLYVTAKAGFIPSMPLNGVTYQQGMFGLGVNYTLFPQIDLLFGFIKWRGLSVGSGLTYNGNTINVDAPISDPNPVAITPVTISGQSFTGLTAAATNVKAKLSINNSSVVIPIDLMTSLQALWFLNFGLGVGADLSFSSASIKMSGASDLAVNGMTGAETTKGSVTLNATDSSGNGDFFNPRIAASVGLDLALLKIDMPVSYYPLQKAFAWGISGGLVW